MKKAKSPIALTYVLKNELQVNVIQVALDHMIEHLSEVATEEKGSEKKACQQRLKEAKKLKDIFGYPLEYKLREKSLTLSYGDFLDIVQSLRANAKIYRQVDMKKEANGFMKLHDKLKTSRKTGGSLTLFI